jgi:4-hydroxyphenylpyruvate dioxygenase-like putative hemolysin
VVAVDHIAVAVPDLEAAILWTEKCFGAKVREVRETAGKRTGMRSAVVELGALVIVLVQGTEEGSQVTEFVRKHGPGVQHIALRVESMTQAIDSLHSGEVPLATPLLHDEAARLKQIFTVRSPETGLMMEFIERGAGGEFSERNVTRLFEALEERELY